MMQSTCFHWLVYFNIGNICHRVHCYFHQMQNFAQHFKKMILMLFIIYSIFCLFNAPCLINRRPTTHSALMGPDYSVASTGGKFYLQPSTPDVKTPKRGIGSSPSGGVHTPHSLEFSTKRRIFDKGPEVLSYSFFNLIIFPLCYSLVYKFSISLHYYLRKRCIK